MAVFPLENGVFSGTLLRFNVRGYVYIWSLIFSMFNFFVGAFMCARRACSLCVYLGKWGNGIRGGMGNWLLNGLIGGNGSISGSVSDCAMGQFGNC